MSICGVDFLMEENMDNKDKLTVLALFLITIASTIYIFVHPSDAVFGIWGGLVGTILAAWKWFDIWDDKNKDEK